MIFSVLIYCICSKQFTCSLYVIPGAYFVSVDDERRMMTPPKLSSAVSYYAIINQCLCLKFIKDIDLQFNFFYIYIKSILYAKIMLSQKF